MLTKFEITFEVEFSSGYWNMLMTTHRQIHDITAGIETEASVETSEITVSNASNADFPIAASYRACRKCPGFVFSQDIATE